MGSSVPSCTTVTSISVTNTEKYGFPIFSVYCSTDLFFYLKKNLNFFSSVSAYPEKIRQRRLSAGESSGIARSLPLTVPIHKHPLLSKVTVLTDRGSFDRNSLDIFSWSKFCNNLGVWPNSFLVSWSNYF
jgi:hypothetical protein